MAYFQILPFPSLHWQPTLALGLPPKPSAYPGRGRDTHLPLVDGNPVSRGKPLVVLDVIDPILEVPIALGKVYLKEVPQQILQVGAEVGWEPHLG